MLGRLGRFLLVAAVLLAQQTALAHQYWHAAKASVSADAKKAPKGDRLCDLHDLLGTVLGVASGAAQTPPVLDFAEAHFVLVACALRQAALLAPHSRDPPIDS
ncbi:MAG: hypothetical protein ABR570_06405 [Burkholderiales bacterium]